MTTLLAALRGHLKPVAGSFNGHGRIRGNNVVAAAGAPEHDPIMAELIEPNSLPPRRRRVVVLAMSPAQILDVTGPMEVLAQAGRLHARERGGAMPGCPRALYDVLF